jgi:hypothetical protein
MIDELPGGGNEIAMAACLPSGLTARPLMAKPFSTLCVRLRTPEASQ